LNFHTESLALLVATCIGQATDSEMKVSDMLPYQTVVRGILDTPRMLRDDNGYPYGPVLHHKGRQNDTLLTMFKRRSSPSKPLPPSTGSIQSSPSVGRGTGSGAESLPAPIGIPSVSTTAGVDAGVEVEMMQPAMEDAPFGESPASPVSPPRPSAVELESVLRQVFTRYDTDRSGTINSKLELQQAH